MAGNAAFTPNAQALASAALRIAPTLPSGYFANDVVFVPINGTQTTGYGKPQMLMTNATTPEPMSLIFLGTGLLSVVGIMKHEARISKKRGYGLKG